MMKKPVADGNLPNASASAYRYPNLPDLNKLKSLNINL
jgi:hypothetical protein